MRTKSDAGSRVGVLLTYFLLLTSNFALPGSAQAADLRVLASNGIKEAVEALKPQLEKASGATLSIDFSTAATMRDRIEKGEAFDVVVLTDEVMAALAKAGKIAPMQTSLARVGIGVAYRKRAAKPDVGTPAAMKQTLLNAKAVAFTGNGASRPAIDRMFERLGIVKEMQSRTRLVPPGASPPAVAKGDADLAVTLISEILPVPGVDLAGPLPADLQQYTGFSAAASPKAAHDRHAAALIAFLRSSAAAPVYRAKGMQVTQ